MRFNKWCVLIVLSIYYFKGFSSSWVNDVGLIIYILKYFKGWSASQVNETFC